MRRSTTPRPKLEEIKRRLCKAQGHGPYSQVLRILLALLELSVRAILFQRPSEVLHVSQQYVSTTPNISLRPQAKEAQSYSASLVRNFFINQRETMLLTGSSCSKALVPYGTFLVTTHLATELKAQDTTNREGESLLATVLSLICFLLQSCFRSTMARVGVHGTRDELITHEHAQILLVVADVNMHKRKAEGMRSDIGTTIHPSDTDFTSR
ncbi:hypothetical protein BJ546DRAFT_649830 [Cryomyces antarcticus]